MDELELPCYTKDKKFHTLIFTYFVTHKVLKLEQLMNFTDLYLTLLCANSENNDLVAFSTSMKTLERHQVITVINSNDQSIRKEYKIVWK